MTLTNTKTIAMTTPEQFDKVYRNSWQNLSVKERINYCASVIYETHKYLTKYSNRLTRIAKVKSRKLIFRAQNELTELVTGVNSRY